MRIVRGDGVEAVDDAGFSHIELPLTLGALPLSLGESEARGRVGERVASKDR